MCVCFYFDNKEEQQELNINKGKNQLERPPDTAGKEEEEKKTDMKLYRKKWLCMFQDLFFYSGFLQFLLHCGILAYLQWVHQSFTHTANRFIEKWLKQAIYEMHKKKKNKGSVRQTKTVGGDMEMGWGSRCGDRNWATERCWREGMASWRDMNRVSEAVWVLKAALLP